MSYYKKPLLASQVKSSFIYIIVLTVVEVTELKSWSAELHIKILISQHYFRYRYIWCCNYWKQYYTILYYTILYYTILYYTILYYTILYYTILYYTMHWTILYYTILYYIILYYTILYYTILYYTILYHTILYRKTDAFFHHNCCNKPMF